MFLPFVIYDHSPAVITIPEGLKNRKRSFRFVNYISDKREFVDCVNKAWESKINGCHMYKVVQKLKRLKNPLNILNWKNGNLSDKVTILKKNLINAQAEMEKDPFNNELKDKAAKLLNEYMEHFKKFLGSKHDVQPLDSVDVSIDKILSEKKAEDMICLVTDEEIKEVVFDIDSNKASGPDGYTLGFFKKAWNIVCKERKNGARRCSLKVDIQKAYDTVSWEFLEKTMFQFSFHPVMINWIMTYVKTSKFSICVNGDDHGYFHKVRGLRQGDPMSPYLFTLVMEVFSLLLAKNIQKAKKFKFHYGCKDLKLSNMCFADDLLVLCNGDVESVGVIKQTMDQFSSIYRLFPNMAKSVIFFGSVPLNV
ncbi:RNA-directed DNA polymerase, eukaryota, reverse transcriptase zinc-binding domain protein [Tanacetum coccineum]